MSPDVEAQAGPQAISRAMDGAEAWHDAGRLQLWSTPRHADFYSLAFSLDSTVDAIDNIAGVLARQVASYSTGRRVLDDSGTVDPLVRLDTAAGHLQEFRRALITAKREINDYWSEISHVGVDPDPQDQNPGEVTDPGW